MRQILYGRATTTHVVRAFPRRSSALKAASARQFGVNFSKIVRWRGRGQVCLWQVGSRLASKKIHALMAQRYFPKFIKIIRRHT